MADEALAGDADDPRARGPVAEVERLGGLTNRVYRVRAGGEPLVLRIPGEGTEAYIDREVEAVNARAAAAAGVSPEVLYVDPRAGADADAARRGADDDARRCSASRRARRARAAAAFRAAAPRAGRGSRSASSSSR